MLFGPLLCLLSLGVGEADRAGIRLNPNQTGSPQTFVITLQQTGKTTPEVTFELLCERTVTWSLGLGKLYLGTFRGAVVILDVGRSALRLNLTAPKDAGCSRLEVSSEDADVTIGTAVPANRALPVVFMVGE